MPRILRIIADNMPHPLSMPLPVGPHIILLDDEDARTSAEGPGLQHCLIYHLMQVFTAHVDEDNALFRISDWC